MSKIRVIVNGVSFYTTRAQIKQGVGDFSSINTFVKDAFKQCLDEGVAGLGRTYEAYEMHDGKGIKKTYQVQINL